MKARRYCKIGTTGSNEVVLWKDIEIKKDDMILAMQSDLYDSLHKKYRDIKSNGMWKEYKVWDMYEDGFLFLELI